jgi:ribosome-associated protein
VLDMTEVSLLADFFVLCNAESRPQFTAILDEVVDQTRAAGTRPLHTEGKPESGWVLIDYGAVVLHIFDPEMRAYYDLEGLWKKARLVVQIM